MNTNIYIFSTNLNNEYYENFNIIFIFFFSFSLFFVFYLLTNHALILPVWFSMFLVQICPVVVFHARQLHQEIPSRMFFSSTPFRALFFPLVSVFSFLLPQHYIFLYMHLTLLFFLLFSFSLFYAFSLFCVFYVFVFFFFF